MAHSALTPRTMAEAILAGQEFAASVADGSVKTDLACDALRLECIVGFGCTFLPTGHGPIMAALAAAPKLTDDEFCAHFADSGKCQAASPGLWLALALKALALLLQLFPVTP